MPDVSSVSEFLLTLNEVHPCLSFTMELEDNGKPPFLRIVIIRNASNFQKPTDTGLCITKAMLRRVLTLSTKPCVQTLLTSNWWQFFQQECERPKMAFSRLHYPNTLVENTIRRFIEMKDFENVFSKQQLSDEQDAAIRIVVPFKDQKSANAVSNSVISVERLMPMSSLFSSQKIKHDQRTIQTKGT